MQTSRWQKCFGCLLRHMCLIVIICLILILIGLAGVGVSAYFLASSKSNYSFPKNSNLHSQILKLISFQKSSELSSVES